MSGPRMVTGCDVVDIARLAAVATRRDGFVARVFTDPEVADCTRGGLTIDDATAQARLAARFAAKEATRKALGDLRLPFHAVEVRRTDGGAPRLHVHGRPSSLSCSLSHDGGVALAVVVGLVDHEPATHHDDPATPHDEPAAPHDGHDGPSHPFADR